MKYLQIFVISLLIALSLAQRERKGGFRNKKFPRPPKLCSTDGDCPNTATCLNPESKPNGICVPKKEAAMFKKLRGCSADSDCEGAMKCKELPKVGINMCMSEALTKMLEMKVARLPGVPKSCVSESDCSGAAKCVDFPKFNKRLCLVEDRHLHKMLMIIHQNFEVKDKDNLGIDDKKEKDGEDNKDKDSGVDLDKKTDDSKKDINYEKDNIDLFISDPQLIKRKNDDRFISDPQFRKRKHGDKGEFGFSKSDDEHHMRNNPWRMFFLGALAMTGVVIIMLTVVMCCLKFRKRRLPGDAAPEEQDTKRNHLRHNAFLTKISTVSHNPYSKLHNEKV